MQVQHHIRYRKRVPVEFEDKDGHHVGTVLNVSEGGVFVSSRARPPVGSQLVLNFLPHDGQNAAGIAARVVWKRQVHRATQTLGEAGIGLEIESASASESEAYQHFVKSLVPALADPSASSQGANEPLPEVPPASFLVRAAVPGTPRTRTFEIDAASEALAGDRVLTNLGDEWRVLEVTASSKRSEADEASS